MLGCGCYVLEPVAEQRGGGVMGRPRAVSWWVVARGAGCVIVFPEMGGAVVSVRVVFDEIVVDPASGCFSGLGRLRIDVARGSRNPTNFWC